LQGCRFGYSLGKRQTKIQSEICYTTWPLAAPARDGLRMLVTSLKNMNAGGFLQLDGMSFLLSHMKSEMLIMVGF
jgi:hypothetical protein